MCPLADPRPAVRLSTEWRVRMRSLFITYLAVIAAGLAYFIVLAALHT
jgi:hypothetical protein